jgi:glutathione reductase (NADPH)
MVIGVSPNISMQYSRNRANLCSPPPSAVLRKFDPLIGETITAYYEKMGIHIHKKTNIKKVELLNAAKDETDPREKQLKLYADDGSELVTNELLWAIGRGAETRNLGLDSTGVKLNESGHVIVDKYQNTSVDGVYALGDITGQAELTR